MVIFQNSALYPNYLRRFNQLAKSAHTFTDRRRIFLHDRFGASHFLKPILDGDQDAFFTNGDDEILQRMWAQSQGLHAGCTLDDILLAQIEACRADVFYNLDPMRFQSNFVRSLPACVRRTVAWRAAPSPRADLTAYDCVVCNFPAILRSHRARGWRAEYFFPAHDPIMDTYAANNDRPTDVIFVGGYSRHHRRRAKLLDAVAALGYDYKVAMHLDRSWLSEVAESAVGRMLPLASQRRPTLVRRIASEPLYGRELYAALSHSKIVINGAIDMAGHDRGNMRCWEAMGMRCLLVSDDGIYPAGMSDDDTMRTFRTAEEAVSLIRTLLMDRERREALSTAGYAMVRSRYSKEAQWSEFLRLIE